MPRADRNIDICTRVGKSRNRLLLLLAPRAVFVACVMLLQGCSQELYANLEEREINEMIASLARYDIKGSKLTLKNGYGLSVPTRYFADSVNILAASGYPRRKYASLNDLFGKSGLIPTPFEEHVRYVYGLSEEVARTVSLFDGVIEARVHIALPDNRTEPGNVSVFIKYDQQFDYETLSPRIRKFISDSVEKVQYKDVQILALPGQKSADFYRIRRKLAEQDQPLKLFEYMLGGITGGIAVALLLVLVARLGYLKIGKSKAPLVVRQGETPQQKAKE